VCKNDVNICKLTSIGDCIRTVSCHVAFFATLVASSCQSMAICQVNLRRYGDSVDNTVEENSSIFSIIRMHWLQSARHAGSKTSHQQNNPVLNCRCWLMQVDLNNGRKLWLVGCHVNLTEYNNYQDLLNLLSAPMSTYALQRSHNIKTMSFINLVNV